MKWVALFVLYVSSAQAVHLGMGVASQAELSSSMGITGGATLGKYHISGAAFGVANNYYYSNQYLLSAYYWSSFGQGMGTLWFGGGAGVYRLVQGITLSSEELEESQADGVGVAIKTTWFPFDQGLALSFESIHGLSPYVLFNSWQSLGFTTLEYHW